MRSKYLIMLVVALSACSGRESAYVPQPISMASSIEGLSGRFEWARDTALSYAHSGEDSVGLWYEAALPGREAFCMRDVSHQAVGAHFLGLDEHTRNMLFQFARHISDDKDWCSFWEITKAGTPAPVDYRDDTAFWYNLPANFDVMDASYRMYQWTSDPTYIEHPVFLNFYEKTVVDYVERWDLGPGEVLDRSRYMNRDTFDLTDPYQYARGIPSYHESNMEATRVGIDLLSFQVAAYRSYAAILAKNGQPDKSSEYLSRAVRASNLLTAAFWREDAAVFHEIMLEDGTTRVGGGMQLYALYNDAVPDPNRAQKIVAALLNSEPDNIEMRSHYPEVLYRYGHHGEALDMLMSLTSETTPRREYPEVSFAVVGALATGLLGISPLEKGIATISRISSNDDWVELRDFEHHRTTATLRHEGTKSSTLSVLAGEKLLWMAKFDGNHPQLDVNGRLMRSLQATDLLGETYSYLEVEVYPEETVIISVPN